MTSAYPLQWPTGWPRTPRGKLADGRNRWGKGEGSKRRPWTFSEAHDELVAELERSGSPNPVVSTNFRLTQGGYPSKNFGVPDDQGVAVYFRMGGKPMVMAQDAFARAEENLRSLALVLKYLRGVEALGGGIMMERAFEGFAAIAAPAKAQEWWQVLGVPENATIDQINASWRDKAKRAHSDAGGSDAAMSALNVARDAGLKARGR